MKHYLKELNVVVAEHKTFVYTILIVLFLSLIRIPFGTFNGNSTIDTISHFILPAFAAPLFYVILRHFSFLPQLKKPMVIWFVVLIGISSETIWEIFEFGIDTYFGTHWQLGNTDTMHDLILAVVGALFGGILYTYAYSTLFAVEKQVKPVLSRKKLSHQ